MQMRIQRVQKFIRTEKLSGFLISFVPHIRYLTGFSGSSALLLILPRSVHFFTDGRYAVQVQTELQNIPNLKIHITRDVPAFLHKQKLFSSQRPLGFESAYVSYAFYEQLYNAVSPIPLRGYQNVLEPLVAVKTASEIRSIRKAAKIAERVYQDILAVVQPGIRELDVAAEISYRARRYGSEGDAFDIIVASGKRSALPHGRATTKKIRAGEIVTIDFGCIVNGFRSDITRTFAIGKASKKARELYQIIHTAYSAAIEQLRAGKTGADIDRAARSIIAAAGYGEFFNHSLGHGLGISVHEYPTLSPRGTDAVIEANTVVTIEPGIYLPNRFGLRIEDDVLVTSQAAKLLSSAPGELITVE